MKKKKQFIAIIMGGIVGINAINFNLIKASEMQQLSYSNQMIATSSAIEVINDVETLTEDSVKLVDYNWENKSGKVVVTCVVERATSGYRNVGVTAIGYDVNGKIVEVKGKSSYLSGGIGKTSKFTVELSSGDLITEVKVVGTGTATQIKLIESGYRVKNDKVVVTGVVEKGVNEAQNIGMTAIGYDEDGKVVEIKGATQYLSAGLGRTGSFNIELSRADLIKEVKVIEKRIYLV